MITINGQLIQNELIEKIFRGLGIMDGSFTTTDSKVNWELLMDEIKKKDILNSMIYSEAPIPHSKSQTNYDTYNVHSIHPSGIEVKDFILTKEEFSEFLENMGKGNLAKYVKSNEPKTATNLFVRELVIDNIREWATNEYIIATNYIIDFDKGDIRWEEKVKMDLNDGYPLESFLDSFVNPKLYHLFENIISTNDKQVLEKTKSYIEPMISQEMLNMIEDFKEEFRIYKENELNFQMEELKEEQFGIKEPIDGGQPDSSSTESDIKSTIPGPKRIEIYIPLAKENIILTRYMDEILNLGTHRDINDFKIEVYSTYYKGEEFIITENNICNTRSEAILRLTQFMGLRQDNTDIRY